MSLLSRPRATVLQRAQSTCQSENSHSSESAAPSNSSSNTSWATHFPSSVSPLPKGAAPPQPSPPALQHEPVSPGTSAKRRSRVLRKSPPPASDSEGGLKRWISFRSSSRGPSRSPSRVRINLDDDPPNAPRHFSLPAPSKSSLPPPSSWGFKRRSRSPPRRARSPPRRPRSPARARSDSGHAPYASEPASRPPDILDGLRAELARLGNDHTSSTGTSIKRKARDRSSMPDPASPHRNKPLPTPPVPSAPASPTALHPPPRPPILFRNSSYAAPSEEEQEEEEAESQFGHFASAPGRSASTPGLPYAPRVSWSDVGHGSGYDDAHLHYQASEGHYQQTYARDRISSRESAPALYPAPRSASASLTVLSPPFAPSTRSVPALVHSTRSTPAHSTRSAPLYTSRTPYIDPQPAAAASTSKLSLGKRIKRTLSSSLSSRSSRSANEARQPSSYPFPETEARQSRAYSYSDTGHGSYMTWSQYDHEHDPPSKEQPRGPRKLKKRAPSLSNSSRSASGSGFTSASAPGLSELLHTPPENSLSRKSSPKRRSRASFPWVGTDTPPVPPLPAAYSPMPTPSGSTPELLSQSPAAPPVRRLTKRRPSQKVDAAAESGDVAVLPPVRAVSPIDLDLRRQFSHTSRSHSSPNLGPPSPSAASGSHLTHPRFLPFMTDSPPESPNTNEPTTHGRPGPSVHQDQPAPERPSYLRSQSNRRWTLAVSEVPDEELVEELERLRSMGWGLGFQGELVRVKSNGRRKAIEGSGDGDENLTTAQWRKEEDEGWLVARRALMVCLEIVRTERNYRDGMVRLQRGETRKAPPPLLLQYLPALISASEAFSSRLDEDPSAWGVSAAFLGVEDLLEGALVAWSGIVGEFFTTNKGKQRRQWSTGTSGGAVDKQQEKERGKERKEKEKRRTAPVLPPVGSSEDGHALVHPQAPYASKSAPSSWRMSMPALSQLLASGTETPAGEARKPRHATGSSGASKMPTVQDLAIQPTQRVMRYVLLYKDLLNSTPITSPARPLVERALEGATRIAQRCNRAQDNAAFLT